jgi:pimeloyl-ACP methyl ester carboxylesterase
VLLHGITMRAEAWVYQLNRALDARLLALDVRGHGRSQPGEEGATIALCARDLKDLLTELDLHRAVLVGHSLGGMILGQFLLDHPEVARDRVAAYGLVGTAGRTPITVPGPLLALLADRLVRNAEAGGRMSSRLGRVPPSDLGEWGVRRAFGREPSRRHIDLVAGAFEQLPPAVFTSLLASLMGFDATEAWARVDRPVGIVHGTLDRVIPFREAKRLAATISGSTLVPLDGVGHLPMYERPDAVSDLVVDLLAAT